LQIVPADTTVNTQSVWTMFLNPTVPLGKECYIRLYLPTDLEYSFEFVTAGGIFLPQSQTEVVPTSDLAFEQPTGAEKRQAIKFSGCNQDSSLGESPFGSAAISQITTQKAKMDSGDFGLQIFKDEDCTQAIATLNKGVHVSADDMQTGLLSNLKIEPLVETVQLTSLTYVEFTTAHNLYKDARIVISLPPGLKPLPDGQKGQVEAFAGSTRATEYTMVDGKVVIDNFVQVSESTAPFHFKFALSDIENQISSKDAGGYTVETFYKNPANGEYFMTDTFTEQSSFTAKPGLLSADKDLSIDDPTNFKDDAIYEFSFSENSMVPKGGYLRVDFPDDVDFNKTVTLKTGSCDPAVTTCQIANDNPKSIIIKTIEQVGKEQPVSVKIGGVKNSRSF
jgi:hypothetical protein